MNEQLRLENLLKVLRRGEYTLSGEEALAFYQSYEYLVKKLDALKAPPQTIPNETKKDPITQPSKRAPKPKP